MFFAADSKLRLPPPGSITLSSAPFGPWVIFVAIAGLLPRIGSVRLGGSGAGGGWLKGYWYMGYGGRAACYGIGACWKLCGGKLFL